MSPKNGLGLHWLFIVCFSTACYAVTPAEKLLKQPDEWFKSEKGREAIESLLSWQSSAGGWPKNEDTVSKSYRGDRSKLKGTFDNGATTGELRVLARAFRLTQDERYLKAFTLGFQHLLEAQYPNGGWPQYYPLSKAYHRHITFNDNCMVRILEFLRDVVSGNDFALLSQSQRLAAQDAVNRGIDCILKCQVVVDGKPTVWCAQHDEVTLAPADARSFERKSLSGGESAGILRFLMSIERPTPAVVNAIRSGVDWYQAAKITGVRYTRGDRGPSLVADANAAPLWARFYEIETNRPFFCGRDGMVKYNLDEIEAERRSGYTWYGNWGDAVLKAYNKWPHRDK